ncbi:MAG: hypothetical protein PHV43_01050 [Candidatus Colwellbacteria bacterium]|nr:hypothetical protein [Candidatus Colwellbacteria bacterium]
MFKDPQEHELPNETPPEKEGSLEIVLDNPERVSYTTIRYNLPESEGLELGAGQSIVFVVPDEYRGRTVRDVVLRHRKAAKYARDIGPDRYDPHGAYSRVEIYDPENGGWIFWKDPKGYSADKFAELRPAGDPENEVLHDWIATVGKVEPNLIRITNVGEGSEFSVAQIHGLEVTFFPDLQNVSYVEQIYCDGTKFVDLEGNDRESLLPRYGGGSHTEGVYKGAMVLGHDNSSPYEPEPSPDVGVQVNGSRLTIDLEPSRQLVQIEIAVGDTEHLDYINPKTNRRTRLGYAKLRVGILHSRTGAIEWFIKDANVPPQGIISGGPHSESVIENGDKIIIESRQDISYIMGWRLAYKDQEIEENAA